MRAVRLFLPKEQILMNAVSHEVDGVKCLALDVDTKFIFAPGSYEGCAECIPYIFYDADKRQGCGLFRLVR